MSFLLTYIYTFKLNTGSKILALTLNLLDSIYSSLTLTKDISLTRWTTQDIWDQILGAWTMAYRQVVLLQL